MNVGNRHICLLLFTCLNSVPYLQLWHHNWFPIFEKDFCSGRKACTFTAVVFFYSPICMSYVFFEIAKSSWSIWTRWAGPFIVDLRCIIMSFYTNSPTLTFSFLNKMEWSNWEKIMPKTLQTKLQKKEPKNNIFNIYCIKF